MSEAAPQAENSTTPNGTEISKIFIGSLSFKTGKPSLTKAFTDLGVEVKTAKVVRNNTGRSMGYGFVEIPDKDADLVISKLHHTELDGRQINVEKATSTKPKRKTKRPQRPRKPTTKSESGESQPAAPKTEKTTKPAPVKKEKKPTRRVNTSSTPREASDTKLYVANIPFSLTDAELAAVFADYGKVEGKVIVNKKTGRSRGYGFVDVENGELQKKAIDEKNKAEIGGRPITVRAAYRELPTPEPTAESATTEGEPKVEEKKDAAAKSPAKKNKKPQKKKVVKKDKPAGEKPANNKEETEAPKSEEKPAENKETPSA